MAMARRCLAGCLLVLAVLGAGWQPAEGASNGGGRRELTEATAPLPWAMRVTTCENLRAAFQLEGLKRIIVMGPIACDSAQWPNPVVVSWDVELMGAVGWEANPLGDWTPVASLDFSGVRTAVVVDNGAVLKVHSLILRLGDLAPNLPIFRLVEAKGLYMGLAVAAASCDGSVDPYLDAVDSWKRPSDLEGFQDAAPVGAGSFLVRDAGKAGSSLATSSLRVCESVFECGASDARIEEVFEGNLVKSSCP